MKARVTLALATCAAVSPAHAWDFSETTICTLRHETPELTIAVSYDYQAGIYALAIGRNDVRWMPGPDFRIRFEGERPITIGTDRHILGVDGKTLTVIDGGFGNVLDGLQFNSQLVAMTGDQMVTIPLAGAEPVVAQFRNCPTAKTS